MSELKNRVAGSVKFLRLEAGELWYVCNDGFTFPVPLEDTAGAIFEAEDKGLFFMKWIRRHMIGMADFQERAAAARKSLPEDVPNVMLG